MKYRTIVADPPWTYEGGMAHGHPSGRRNNKPLPYPCLSTAEIAAIPVGTLSAADARLFLWTTNRYLPESFGVLTAWGFRYVQTLVWHKTGTPSPFGGSVAPNHAEFLLVGRRGSPAVLTRYRSSVVAASAGRNTRSHSEKPDAFLDLVETVSPGPYLEMFARRHRLGWDVWGDEVESDVEMAVA